MIGMDRVGGQGDSALTIQLSQAGWTDVMSGVYLSTIEEDYIVPASRLEALG